MTPEQERQSAGLMRLAQQGDQVAYAALLVILSEAARRFARSRVGAVAWVDDVVQETLIAVHRARRAYDAARPFAPWFYAIASSRLIDVIRRERRITAHEVAGDALPDEGRPPDPGRTEVDADAIRVALAALPARQRDIILGLKYRDESVRDVAGRLGMTESAVKVSAHRGYRSLKRLLGVARED